MWLNPQAAPQRHPQDFAHRAEMEVMRPENRSQMG
jgi:hypothetical protein